jgi:hypothetical protein
MGRRRTDSRVGNQLVIDLAQNRQGQWVGSAIVPGFGIKGIPLADVTVKDSSVSFAVKNALGNPTFEGHLASNGTLTGEFKQAGHSAPFTLQNVGPAQVELPPVSTPVSKELEGEWKGEMSFGGNQFRISITRANQADGKATGQFVIIGKKENKLSIDLGYRIPTSSRRPSDSNAFIFVQPMPAPMTNCAGTTPFNMSPCLISSGSVCRKRTPGMYESC